MKSFTSGRPLAIIIATIAILLGALTVQSASPRQSTTRRTVRVARTIRPLPSAALYRDSVHTGVHAGALLRLSGYDKPLRSSRESIFATNLASDTVNRVVITLTYRDMQSRELHSRSVPLQCTIPPGATRSLSFASWDKQKSLYYHLSRRPRTANASPYRVECVIDSITLSIPVNGQSY